MSQASGSRFNDDTAIGFVLAGGRSLRMGSDKARVRLAGRDLICHAIETLREVGVPVAIVGTRPDLVAYAPVVADVTADKGPLSGICSGLQSTNARRAVFIPVDMPLIPAFLIRYMLERSIEAQAAITIVEDGGFAHTFPAVIDRAILPTLLRALEDDDLGCLSAFRFACDDARMPLVKLSLASFRQSIAERGIVSESAHSDAWLVNVNSPEDLQKAKKICESGSVSTIVDTPAPSR